MKGYNALDEEAMKINFRILPPSYLTPWAKSIYALITIALIIWIINFFRVRTRLRNERAEKARVIEQTRQKMDFYANISHEFTSPLSNIIAPVSKMMLSTKSNSIKSELESVQLNAMKINSMIHRIIEFDRIDTNYNTSLILSAVDIVELTGSIFAYTRERNDNKKLQIWNMSSDNDSTILTADVLKIESIISNILSNASRYTPEGGRITLSVTTTDSMCIIEVKDNGIGIPEKDLPYVTQRFFQSSNNTEKKEGTGVGLYRAKMYTEMHNGTLTISSKEGEGTSVIVSLPLISIEENNSGEKNPEDMMLHAMQIMAQHDLNKKKEKLDSILPEGEKTDDVSVDELFLEYVTSAIEDSMDDLAIHVTSCSEELNMSNK